MNETRVREEHSPSQSVEERKPALNHQLTIQSTSFNTPAMAYRRSAHYKWVEVNVDHSDQLGGIKILVHATQLLA
jgi:hypothetical protein